MAVSVTISVSIIRTEIVMRPTDLADTQVDMSERLTPTYLATTGQIEISGRRYVTPECLAATLGVTTRTLCRWDASRIGPPKIKIGKVILFDQAKLPEWLASRETELVRSPGRRR
jgi:hypothetical protein